MKRYYLSKIFQDVTGEYGLAGAWMHKLQTYPDREYLGGEIAVDSQTGQPTEKALLCLVAGKHHAALAADPDLIPMPDVPRDMKVASIHTPTKLKAKGDIKKLGFTQQEVDDVWDNADGMRDVLNHYGKRNNPAFDVNDFDLTDL